MVEKRREFSCEGLEGEEESLSWEGELASSQETPVLICMPQSVKPEC